MSGWQMGSLENWREKYLNALDMQEQLEQKLAAHSDVLRRIVVNLGAAAAGLDDGLDAAIVALKDKIRGASGSVVYDQTLALEAKVQSFERQRNGGHQALLSELLTVLESLRGLRLPSDVRDDIKQFSRQLNKLQPKYSQYPDLLKRLNLLHAQALAAAAEPDKGLFERFRGGRRLQVESLIEFIEPVSQPSEPQRSELQGREAQQHESLEQEPAEQEPAEQDKAETPTLENTVLDRPVFEQSLDDIAEALREILGEIQPSEQNLERLNTAKMRLGQELDSEMLLQTLQDLRDILRESLGRSDEEFSEYLSRVNSQLKGICDSLGVSVEKQLSQQTAAQTLDDAVSTQMEHMQESLKNSSSLDELKSHITEQIESINQALSRFRASQLQSAPLSEDLLALISRVRKIENESLRAKAELAHEHHRALTDPLTELPNREAYNERSLQEWQRFKRYGEPLCLAVADIDHFKKFNDNYGHQVGDRVLKLVAKALRAHLREVDFIARYGGEEFVIFFPHTDLEGARTVLEKVRSMIAETSFRFRNQPISLTLSMGLTQLIEGDSVEQAFERADRALYEAKKRGRNKVVAAGVGK